MSEAFKKFVCEKIPRDGRVNKCNKANVDAAVSKEKAESAENKINDTDTNTATSADSKRWGQPNNANFKFSLANSSQASFTIIPYANCLLHQCPLNCAGNTGNIPNTTISLSTPATCSFNVKHENRADDLDATLTDDEDEFLKPHAAIVKSSPPNTGNIIPVSENSSFASFSLNQNETEENLFANASADEVMKKEADGSVREIEDKVDIAKVSAALKSNLPFSSFNVKGNSQDAIPDENLYLNAFNNANNENNNANNTIDEIDLPNVDLSDELPSKIAEASSIKDLEEDFVSDFKSGSALDFDDSPHNAERRLFQVTKKESEAEVSAVAFKDEEILSNLSKLSEELFSCSGKYKSVTSVKNKGKNQLGNSPFENNTHNPSSVLNQENFNNGRWLPEEHDKFIQAIYLYGNEWKRVQEYIGSRSSTQARSHAQKFFIRLRKKFRIDDLHDESNMLRKSEEIIKWIKSIIPEHIAKRREFSQNFHSANDNKFIRVIAGLINGDSMNNTSRKKSKSGKSLVSGEGLLSVMKKQEMGYDIDCRDIRDIREDTNIEYKTEEAFDGSQNIRSLADNNSYSDNCYPQLASQKIKIPLDDKDILELQSMCSRSLKLKRRRSEGMSFNKTLSASAIASGSPIFSISKQQKFREIKTDNLLSSKNCQNYNDPSAFDAMKNMKNMMNMNNIMKMKNIYTNEDINRNTNNNKNQSSDASQVSSDSYKATNRDFSNKFLNNMNNMNNLFPASSNFKENSNKIINNNAGPHISNPGNAHNASQNMIKQQIYNPGHKHYINIVNINIDGNNNSQINMTTDMGRSNINNNNNSNNMNNTNNSNDMNNIKVESSSSSNTQGQSAQNQISGFRSKTSNKPQAQAQAQAQAQSQAQSNPSHINNINANVNSNTNSNINLNNSLFNNFNSLAKTNGGGNSMQRNVAANAANMPLMNIKPMTANTTGFDAEIVKNLILQEKLNFLFKNPNLPQNLSNFITNLQAGNTLQSLHHKANNPSIGNMKPSSSSASNIPNINSLPNIPNINSLPMIPNPNFYLTNPLNPLNPHNINIFDTENRRDYMIFDTDQDEESIFKVSSKGSREEGRSFASNPGFEFFKDRERERKEDTYGNEKMDFDLDQFFKSSE